MATALSHSRISVFEDCPFQFNAVFLEKAPQIKSWPMLLGSLVHLFAERYVKYLVSQKKANDFTASKEMFEVLWADRHKDKELALLPESYYAEAKALCWNFTESHVIDPASVVGIELEIAFDKEWNEVAWMDKSAFFRMKIDRLDVGDPVAEDEILEIIDYKSGYAMDSTDATASNPQLRRYAMGMLLRQQGKGAVQAKYLHRIFVTLDYIRHQIQKRVEIDITDLVEVEQKRILATSARVEGYKASGNWPATPGPGCSFCPVFDRCPTRSLAQPFHAPDDPEAAEHLLQRLVILDRECDDIKASLRAFGEMYGPVVSNGMQYGPSLVHTRSYTNEEITAWAGTFGININLALKAADKSTLYRLAKTDAAKDSLGLMGVDKSRTEYRMKKAAVEAEE